MSQRTMTTVMLVTLCVSLMVGVVLNPLVLDSLDNDVVKVDISEGETQVIEFDRLALVPGQREEYVIDVADDIVGDFDLVSVCLYPCGCESRR